ncbi:3274_t:CDS:2 [Entrophospora sp. SA101]|nr:3274_t:CDS:2 [Entrophospora sp. SA101]
MKKEIAANNDNNCDEDIDLGVEALNSKGMEIDALLQLVDFKERIKENFSKVENLSDIISSLLVDEVSEDGIKEGDHGFPND